MSFSEIKHSTLLYCLRDFIFVVKPNNTANQMFIFKNSKPLIHDISRGLIEQRILSSALKVSQGHLLLFGFMYIDIVR